MSEDLKIAIEEIDALTHEWLGKESKDSLACGDAAVALMDARKRILERAAAALPPAFENPTPTH